MLRKRRQLDVHLAEASALLERYSQVFSRDFAHILIHRPFPPFTQSPPWCEAAVPDHAGGARRSGRVAGNSTAGDVSGSFLQSVFRCLFLQLQPRDGSGFACNGITELQAAHRCNLCYHKIRIMCQTCCSCCCHLHCPIVPVPNAHKGHRNTSEINQPGVMARLQVTISAHASENMKLETMRQEAAICQASGCHMHAGLGICWPC
jgi:hypothetical protein